MDLDRTTQLFRTSGTGGRLLGIVERRHNDLRVRQLRKIRNKRLTIKEIDTCARWTTEPHRVQLGDIAKVVFGGQYLERLAAVAADR